MRVQFVQPNPAEANPLSPSPRSGRLGQISLFLKNNWPKIGLVFFLLIFFLLSFSFLFKTFGRKSPASEDPASPLASGKQNVLAQEATPTPVPVNLTLPATVEAKPKPPVKVPPPASSEADQTAPPVNVVAHANRLNFPINKFGIYSNNPGGDLDLAKDLVNSSGGDWGWILTPLNVHDGSVDGWNSLFSRLAEKHLIPIVQLIEPESRSQVPSEADIDQVAKFLGSLSWPTRLKVVSAFNEVNASEYWGGKIDPEGYARILNRLIDQLKSQSADFFVLNGAFNASAQTGDSTNIHCIRTDLGVDSCYLSEIGYLQRMNTAVPGIFKKLDGWASHVYPFPGYRGTPGDQRVGAESSFEAGRNTIHSYQFELRLLAQYGIHPPIFITETGWPHKEGQTAHPEWYDAATVASFYKQAFVNYFLPDANVVAVTPFVLTNNFDNFAFVGVNGAKFPQWDAVVAIPKTAGNPPR